MSTMVERVAKRLAGVACDDHEWPGFLDERTRDWWRDRARAAIEAMREPSMAMVEAGDTALENAKDSGWDSGPDGESYNTYEYIFSGAQTDIYQAMIDAALAEKPE